MPRTRRAAGLDRTVRRTVKSASARARKARTQASSGGADLIKAVQGVVKSLPISELEKRLAGLEKTVAKLEGELRKAAQRVGTAVRDAAPSKARRSTKRSTTKRTTTARKPATRKRATKRATKRTTTRKSTSRRTTS